MSKAKNAEPLGILEAARELGMTPDALRARVKRGTVEAFKADDGRTWMLARADVDALADELLGDMPGGRSMPSGRLELVAALARAESSSETLRDEVEYLRERLEALQGERAAEAEHAAAAIEAERERRAAELEAARATLRDEAKRYHDALEAERERVRSTLADAADERTRMLAMLARMAPMLADADANGDDDARGRGSEADRRQRSPWARVFGGGR